jgi:hypothetical protein
MIEWHRTMVIACAALFLAACGGGSGSTGLISQEGALLTEVRRDGTCVEADGIAFCATDSTNAIAPGGQSADGPLSTAQPTPAATATAAPGVPTASPTPGAQGTPGGPAPTATPSGGAPAPTATPAGGSSGEERGATFSVEGFAAGAACALVGRPAGSEESWRTGPLVALDTTRSERFFPLATSVPEGPTEIVLLCFASPPTSLAPELERLADADPDVIFVPANAIP